MADRREEFVAELLDICRTLESNSDGRVHLVYAEGDETQDPEMEAAHFLKLDGIRLGRDIELLGFMTELAGFGMPMSDFAQAVCIIKAKGCGEAYEAVRQRCSDLEQYLEQEHREAWRNIFSIPAKETKDECDSSDTGPAEEGDHTGDGNDHRRAHAEQP